MRVVISQIKKPTPQLEHELGMTAEQVAAIKRHLPKEKLDGRRPAAS